MKPVQKSTVEQPVSRRGLLGGIFATTVAVAAGSGHAAPPVIRGPAAPRKKVAAIVTEYRYYSHAHVLLDRVINGYFTENAWHKPRIQLVSMYTHQVPANDMSRDVSQRHNVPIFSTVANTLTLQGDAVAVDGVLLIGEHGNYPYNEIGQKLYPRYELYQQITDTFRRSGRAVPVFNDKHLSTSFLKAKEMYDEARELGFPLMAGSSIPITVRRPEIDLPLGASVEHVVGTFHKGSEAQRFHPLEAYGFHGLEMIQCMVERRKGGETGLRGVQMLQGQSVWKWRDGEAGRWSAPLLRAALACAPEPVVGTLETHVKDPVVLLLEYRDGLRAALFGVGGHAKGFTFAAKVKGQERPLATSFGSNDGHPLKSFDALTACIDDFMASGQISHPVERTLLVTGALEALFKARRDGARRETPELALAYPPPRRPYRMRG